MRLFILIFLICSSCMPKAKGPNGKLYLAEISTEELSPPFRKILYDSLVELNAEAGREIVSLHKKTDRPLFIYSRNPEVIGNKTILAHASYMKYKCLIEFDENNYLINQGFNHKELDVKYILLHELGHCYGHLHTEEEGHIMNEVYTGSSFATNEEIQKIKKIISNFLNLIY